MTHLGTLLLDQYQLQDMTADAMAKRMDIDPVVLSRIKRGEQFVLDFKTLSKMIAGISEDRIVRESLVACYLSDLRDHCPSIRPENIRIEVRTGTSRVSEEPKPRTIHDSHSELLEAIKESGLRTTEIDDLVMLARFIRRDTSVRQAIKGLAEMIRRNASRYR